MLEDLNNKKNKNFYPVQNPGKLWETQGKPMGLQEINFVIKTLDGSRKLGKLLRDQGNTGEPRTTKGNPWEQKPNFLLRWIQKKREGES